MASATVDKRSYHGGSRDNNVVVCIHFRFAGSLLLDDRQYARIGTVRPLATSISLVATSERLERQSDQYPTDRFTETEVGRVCRPVT